ncbi:hypothetical protein D3C78_411640 [compost metagenome]
MAGWRDAVLTHDNAAGLGDFPGDLVLGQDAAVAGLGALAHLDLDHPHLRAARLGGKTLGVEAPVRCAAAEVAAAQFPHQVAAVFAVVGADAAFAGVMVEVAQLGPLVERADGIGTQRAKAHGGNVEDRCRIGLAALRSANDDPEA